VELVAIAKIVKPRGLKGEVVAELLTHFPERFEGLKKVTAVREARDPFELKIEDHWFQKDRVVLKFAGFDTIESAETLRSVEICVPETEAVTLDEGEYFDWQLTGCKVEAIDGMSVGEVTGLMRTGGTELLVVIGEKEFLIPFVTAICVAVDIENKLVVIDPPDGLLEF
jgi:16S rRNA processing protein RimM